MNAADPDVDRIIAYLTEHGKKDMAWLVGTIHRSEVSLRKTYERNLRELQELKLKYEPPRFVDPGPTWTGD